MTLWHTTDQDGGPVSLVRSSPAIALALCGALVLLVSCGGDDGPQTDCTAVLAKCLSVDGFGPVRWGDSVAQVEDSLDVQLDCSDGLTPGTCTCPQLRPGSPVYLVFDGTDQTLQAMFLGSPAGTRPNQTRTREGVGIGDPAAAVADAYPTATLHLRAGLTSGLSDFYLFREHGHALAFTLSDGRVSGIDGFADGRPSSITGELCA